MKNKLLNSYNSNISNIKNNNEEYYNNLNTEPSLISNNFISNFQENNSNNLLNKQHKNKLFQYLPKLRSKSQNKNDFYNSNDNNYNKIDIKSDLIDLNVQYESVKKDLIEINP
jgi:hypothetical protein